MAQDDNGSQIKSGKRTWQHTTYGQEGASKLGMDEAQVWSLAPGYKMKPSLSSGQGRCQVLSFVLHVPADLGLEPKRWGSSGITKDPSLSFLPRTRFNAFTKLE